MTPSIYRRVISTVPWSLGVLGHGAAAACQCLIDDKRLVAYIGKCECSLVDLLCLRE